MTIQLNPTPDLAANPDALAAIQRAAVRDQLIADATTHLDKAMLLSLPTETQFTSTLNLPSGWSYAGRLAVPDADAKALGLPPVFGGADAAITFNSTFSYYYGPGDVPAGLYDLQTAATHEIGHALGFSSNVDWIDNLYNYTGLSVSPKPLDLFRFRTADLPLAQTDFANAPRSLEPGVDASLSDGVSANSMSTGIFLGDGFGASHWKRSVYADQYIGVMDPALSSGMSRSITSADIRALELIGYDLQGTDIPAPEPATFMVVGGALILLALRRPSR
jgi:hypothetical protein